MVRNLTTLVLAGALGMMVFGGSAQACHKRSCGQNQACAMPAPCPAPVVCAPRVKKTCCLPKIKLCSFHMPKFCHKQACAPAPTACASPVYAAPQASGQY